MSKTAAQPLGLIINPPPVVHTLVGISSDIHRVSGNMVFVCSPSMPSPVEEYALKVFRVHPTDYDRMENIENVLTRFSECLSANKKAYTHPNIAPCAITNLRMATNRGPVTFKALLTPWYSGGNILEYVKTFPGVNRTALLIEIGKALRHLHAHDVVHGAIYPHNILVDGDGHVGITDVGIRTFMSQFTHLSSGHLSIPPSARYQSAAQATDSDTFVTPTTSTDVYSFATTAWAVAVILLYMPDSRPLIQHFHQVFAGKEPFSDVPRFRRYEQVVAEIGYRGHQRLVKPDDMSDELWALLQRCLAADPVLRPAMHEVVAELECLSA